MAYLSSHPRGKYDVFLSLLGVDVRTFFVSYLYKELGRLGIKVFQRDVKLERGTSISDDIFDAIKESRFAIVVISENCFKSTRCLEELAKIIDQFERGSLRVIPVFYGVHRLDVRNWRGKFGEAFQKGEHYDLMRWKRALSEVANISGYDSRDWDEDAELIQNVSREVLHRLTVMLPSDYGDLVGIDAHIKEIESLLSGTGDEVRMIGIWGTRGTGKTKLARDIYMKHYDRFQACCFIDNVEEIYKLYSPPGYVQQLLLGNIVQRNDRKFSVDIRDSSSIRGRLSDMKVLLVLDNVDKIDQLALAGQKDLFGPGSRIIITSRDKDLLLASRAHKVKVYEIKSSDDATICSDQKDSTSRGKVWLSAFWEHEAEVCEIKAEVCEIKSSDDANICSDQMDSTSRDKDLLLAHWKHEAKVYEIKSSDDANICADQMDSTDMKSASYAVSKYDVFLSFHDGDIGSSFVSHLCNELNRSKIKAFKGDKKAESGSYINCNEAIKESKYAIVIISENYAFSPGCLEELAMIHECNRNGSQVVIPIFYDVNPLDVRKLRRQFCEAFQRHEEEKLDCVERWKQAISRVGNFPGWDSRNWTDDSEMIQSITCHILDQLNPTASNDSDDLVGLNHHMEALEPLLSVGYNDEVRMIGICGMGGIGKTTIAEYIYKRLSHQFEVSCFMGKIKDIYKSKGQVYLQQQFLSKILQEENVKFPSYVDGSNVIKARLEHRKVLVVLDDVDNWDQLNALAKKTDWFGPGSRIVVTSRKKSLLSTFKVYEVGYMNDEDALQLFSLSAFGQKVPEEDFLELSNCFVEYARGLPLALKTYGSSLRGTSKKDWEAEAHKLGKSLPRNIMEVLKDSYDELSGSLPFC